MVTSDFCKVGDHYYGHDKSLKSVKTSFHQEFDVYSPRHGRYKYVFNLNVGGFDGFEGRICFKEIDEGLLETHSRLDSRIHGLGYGIEMYSHGINWCLREGWKVCSSRHFQMSKDAARLWQSNRLRRAFDISCEENDENGRYWVNGLLIT